jgi:hypothetical protein
MVHSAMLVECRSEEVVNITILADITLYECETIMILAQLLSVVFIDVSQNNFGPGLREKSDRRCSNACCTTCYPGQRLSNNGATADQLPDMTTTLSFRLENVSREGS